MLHVPLHIKSVINIGGVSLWVSSVGILWPREWPFIKLKHIKLGKPDTQEHYPSKGESTPAIPYGKMFLTVL